MFVYIREAHPTDEWALPSNDEEGISFAQPRSWSDRQSLAQKCCSAMNLSMPCGVDDIDNTVDQAYAAWPERMFVIDGEGRIAYAGRQGPWGFKPQEVERWLKKHAKP